MAMQEPSEVQEQRLLAFGLRQNSGPESKDVFSNLPKLPVGSQVYEFRTKNRGSEGAHTFIIV